MRPLARVPCAGSPGWRCRLAAGDLDVVVDVDDPDGHPGSLNHRVVFGPGADMASQRDNAALGVRPHTAAVIDQRRAVQRLLYVQVDVDRVGTVDDLNVVADAADTDQACNGRFGSGAFRLLASECASATLNATASLIANRA